MNYWIFVAANHNENDGILSGRDVFKQRMEDEFWGLSKRTPNRNKLAAGDKVVFYIASPEKSFAASAVLETDSFKLEQTQIEKFSHDNEFFTSEYGVKLTEIDIWEEQKPAENIISYLQFIENKEYWYTYFQGGIRKISEGDYNVIVTEEFLGKDKNTTKESMGFQLEDHLEHFIEKNWDRIEPLSPLKLYETEAQNGRQFPADTWSMDFLAQEKTTNNFVVIELKRGKTSDSTVGQILRYINWVKENLTNPHQNVKGIIIAEEVDSALEYAIKGLPISVMTYEIDFNLKEVIDNKKI